MKKYVVTSNFIADKYDIPFVDLPGTKPDFICIDEMMELIQSENPLLKTIDKAIFQAIKHEEWMRDREMVIELAQAKMHGKPIQYEGMVIKIDTE